MHRSTTTPSVRRSGLVGASRPAAGSFRPKADSPRRSIFSRPAYEGHYGHEDPNDFRYEGLPCQPVDSRSLECFAASFEPHSFTNSRSDETFAPIGELRLNAHYQLTKVFALKMGYTGIIAGGMGRASRRIDYTLPDITIRGDRKSEAFITNGFDFGFEMNR